MGTCRRRTRMMSSAVDATKKRAQKLEAKV
jgi:hypothetical protein